MGRISCPGAFTTWEGHQTPLKFLSFSGEIQEDGLKKLAKPRLVQWLFDPDCEDRFLIEYITSKPQNFNDEGYREKADNQ